MDNRQRIIPSSLLIPHSLAAADGGTGSSTSSAAANLYVPDNFSIPQPPMPTLGLDATPLFHQNHLMKFLTTIGAVDVPSPDLINSSIQPWDPLGGGLSDVHHLPGLRSLEPRSSDVPLILSGESSNKQLCPSPFPPPLLPPPLTYPDPAAAMMTSKLERQRRSTMGDRIRILEGLMPSRRKMDAVTVLAEVHKYVKFLEAQVTALQSMPSESSGFSREPFCPSDMTSAAAIGGLGRLNRQQMLQVMLNSPVVLDLLCKRGCCVMSADQAEALRQTMAPRPELMLLPGTDGAA